MDDAAVVRELHGDIGACERDAAKHLVAVRELGGLGLQELAPRRSVVIKIGDVDDGAMIERRRRHDAVVGIDAPGVRGPGGKAGDRRACDCRDRGERLATKAHRADVLEIVEACDLARRMAVERECEFVARDAAAVVGHPDAPHTPLFELYFDRAGAGIDGVLEQFLEHRGGPFDDLAGGDLVDQEVGERTDRGHARHEVVTQAVIIVDRWPVVGRNSSRGRRGRWRWPTESAIIGSLAKRGAGLGAGIARDWT